MSVSFPIAKVTVTSTAKSLIAGSNIDIASGTIGTVNNPTFKNQVSAGAYNLKAGAGLSFDGIQYALAQAAGNGISVTTGAQSLPEYVLIAPYDTSAFAAPLIGYSSLLVWIFPDANAYTYTIPSLVNTATVIYNPVNASVTPIAAIYSDVYNAAVILYGTQNGAPQTPADVSAQYLGMYDVSSGTILNWVELTSPMYTGGITHSAAIIQDNTGSILYNVGINADFTQTIFSAYSMAAVATAPVGEILPPLWQASCSFSSIAYPDMYLFNSPNHEYIAYCYVNTKNGTLHSMAVIDTTTSILTQSTLSGLGEQMLGILDNGYAYTMVAGNSSLSGVYQYNMQGSLTASSINTTLYNDLIYNYMGVYNNVIYAAEANSTTAYTLFIFNSDLSVTILIDQVYGNAYAKNNIYNTHGVSYLYGNSIYESVLAPIVAGGRVYYDKLLTGFTVGVNNINNASPLSDLVAETGLSFANSTITNTSPLSGLSVGDGLAFTSSSVLTVTAYQEYQIARTSDLTAQTSTLTTPVVASSISFTATLTGFCVANAVIRGSNNTVGDGLTIAVYQGTVLLDSETYTQEGVAGNQHSFVFSSTSSIPLNTATGFTLQYNAVTGGIASVKITNFEIKEVSVI